MKVMIAGIGGASLGTELPKCLTMTEEYSDIECDISRFAFGPFVPKVESLQDKLNWCKNVKP